MKHYISYGGGVNSTAMIIYMFQQGLVPIDEIEIVFADTGAEWPETYDYVGYFTEKYLRDYGQKVKVLTSKAMGVRKESLLEFYQRLSLIPSRLMRICTADWKIKPIFKYYEKPCVQYLGIDAGEAHRAKPARDKQIINEFPLVEAGITRQECKRIILKTGLCLPIKSGCYFCPFARISQYKQLYQQHPSLFQVVLELEDEHSKRHNSKIHIKDKPMHQYAERFRGEDNVAEGQLELWDDYQDSMNCLCKFS